jgi:uncharacterized repeat protein (TIGR01451 family)
MKRLLVLTSALIVALGGTVSTGTNPGHKIAVHVVPHGTACTSLPTFSQCSEIRTTHPDIGEIDVIPVFYDLNEYGVVEFALSWPPEWGSISYTRCAGDIVVGGIVNPGDGIATAWFECQRTWSLSHGYGLLSATGAGVVRLLPNPATGDYGVVNCGLSEPVVYDYPAAVFSAGVGGATGDDPCRQVFLPLELGMTDGLGGNCVDPGNNVTYTISYGNTLNPSDVHNVIVIDHLPAQTTFVSASAGGAYDDVAHTVTWSLGTLASMERDSMQVVVTADAAEGAVLANTCEMTCDEASPAWAMTQTDVCTRHFSPLGLSKTDALNGACAYRGDSLTYVISYDNSPNPWEAHNVVLVDSLPQGMEFISASQGGLYDPAGRSVTWAIATLAPGESGSEEVAVRVKASPATTVKNKCRITSDETPAKQVIFNTNVCDSLYHVLNVSKTAVLTGDCVNYGANLTYRISYDNTPNSYEVHNAVLTDFLPAQTDFVSASSGGVYDPDALAVTWNIGTLAPGAGGSRQITVKVNVARGNSFTNQCALTSDEAPRSEASRSVRVCGGSQGNPHHKIAVHVKAHPTSCTKGYPTFTNCSQIVTTYPACGDFDVVPVFYDLAEYGVVEFALQWPVDWGTCSFVRCKGDIAVGEIVHAGDGIAVAWSECQYTWAVAPGVGWLLAAGPGEILPCPNPATGDLGVFDCAPSPHHDYPTAISRACIGGRPGDDPCRPAQLEPATWGAIKATFK